MTSTEMKELLLLKYDNLLGYPAPPYNNAQLSKILTDAQTRLVKALSPQFETDNQIREYLKPLLITGVMLNTTTNGVSTIGTGLDTYKYTYPSNILRSLREYAIISNLAVNIKPVTQDFINANIGNPYKQPYSKLCWKLDKGLYNDLQVVELFVPLNTTVTNYVIDYLKYPSDIVIGSVDCALSPSLHNDIVDEAVNILKASNKPSEYQISSMESNK